ncbi:hypothetical protein QYE76_034072 [Lolium multiflorum]|uniref:RING-type E3 ubiquitin transferase n=1 Tax=Lolium multiflorum TaxID=4521 RepID=A0AAD8VKV8_LOLMU|nr:hypothetical protein QYE76_034072 [Lolium multiflorum]
MSSLLPPFPPDLSLPPPRPPPPPPPLDENRILIVRLVMAFALSLFAIFLCGCCKGYRNSQARAAAAAAAGERPPGQGLQQLEPRGTNTAARLPAFKYNRSVKHKVAGAGEEAATCSVCLGAFQHGESVRLLPACLHLFHVQCIDPWLDAHSTCPICRSDTHPTMGVGRLPNV